MPSAEVASVSRSIPIKPRGVTSTPSSGCSQDRSGAWPIARITESHSMTFSVPPTNCGLNRPSASKTEETSSVWSPVTEPLPRIACGPRRVMTSMPSTSASSISNSCAGISCRFSSATTRTRRAPIRLATRATSKVAVAAAPASSISSVVRVWEVASRGDLAERRARGVERDVPAADHQDVLAQLDAVAEVRVQEEVDGAQDPVLVHAGDLQVAPAHAADPHEDRREPVVLQRRSEKSRPRRWFVRSSTPMSRIARISSWSRSRRSR